MQRLLIATRNSHKTQEFHQILGADFEVHDLTKHPEIPEIVESGATFEENAVLKAVAVSNRCAGIIMADDSGLEVDALEGAPGILSARYAGAGATHAQNIAKLLGNIRQKASVRGKPSARFHCVIALARDAKVLQTFHATVEGVIVDPPRGRGGFGYDPIFLPNGFDQTFAELPEEVKNRISHRGKASQAAAKFLKVSTKVLVRLCIHNPACL